MTVAAPTSPKKKRHEKKKPKLRFLKCPDYKLIPQKLIDQVEAFDWSVEKFVMYQEALKDNGDNLLFCITDARDKEPIIRGFLWAQVDQMKASVIIHAYSVEPQYQDGNLVPFCKRFMEMLIRKSDGRLKNIYWFTDRVKAYEKHGMKRSKYTLMCLNEET